MGEPAPSSHGSLREEGGRDPPGEESGFDSDEYREFLRFKRRSRRLREEDEDRETEQKGNSGPAPEWDGHSLPFQDWLVKARLWLATTKAKKKAQGPMLLQKLSGPPFQAFKHLAKDQSWLDNERGGHVLLDTMDLPEHYGEDKEEDLLASLSKITYHLRRGRDEKSRDFFARWDEALRKVDEHRVQLPDQFLGFLMVNALGLGDQEIKTLLAFTRGSIATKEIREFVRKHEMKLQSREVGAEKKSYIQKNAAAVHHIEENVNTENDEDYHEMEQALEELQEDEAGDEPEDGEWAIEEHEAAEILATMMNTQQKKSFTQSWKLKKAKELARGYSNWKRDGKGSGKGKGKSAISDVKAITKCAICGKVGHWHRECPEKGSAKDKYADREKTAKEVHLIQTEDHDFDEAYFCGFMETETTESEVRETLENGTGSNDYGLEKMTVKEIDCSEVTIMDSAKVTMVRGSELGKACVETVPDELGLRSGEELLINAESRQVSETLPTARHFADLGHDTTAFCQYKDHSSLGNVSETREHEIYWHEKTTHGMPEDDSCATIDTGCQRMAIGSETLGKLIKHLPEELPILKVCQENRFKSVHGFSSTKHIATVPASIGHRGCILRPAIFDDECSRKAPFLISLPFLLHCRAIMHLDPTSQLRIHFRRYRFTALCHIGPTGALRMPLTQFTRQKVEQLRKAYDEYQQQQGEFDMYKVDSEPAATSAEKPSFEQRVHPPPGLDHGREDGHDLTEQEGKADDTVGGRENYPGMDSNCAEGVVHHAEGDRTRARPPDYYNREIFIETTVQRVPHDQSPTRHSIGDRLTTVGMGDRGGGAITEPGVRVRGGRTVTIEEPRRSQHGELSDTGDPQHRPGQHWDDGRTTDVSTRQGMQALPMSQGGTQSGTSDVAMPGEDRRAVQDLHLAGLSTSLVSTNGDPRATEDSIHDVREPKRDDESLSSSLPTQQYHPAGIERLPDQREVQGLWEGAQGDQDGQRIIGNKESSQESVDADTHGRRDDRPDQDRGVRTVPQVERDEGEAEPEQWQRQVMHDRTKSEELHQQSDHLWRQATAALKVAESAWTEIMNLLATNSPEEVGLIRLEKAKAWQKEGHGKGRPLRTYANILGTTEERLKTVAELFNPNRFGPDAQKIKLVPGTAFDLQLGINLLDKNVRNEVETYFDRVRPGLVIISPPCTMYSLLQNLNKRNQQEPEGLRRYLKATQEARTLLRFGVMVAKKVLDYGGIFVFEHPVTSKAWALPELQELLQHPKVRLARCDQCQFGLKVSEKGFLKKPTGWATNSERIQKALERPCDHSHDHQHVIGSVNGKSVSRVSQEYPPASVRTILRNYRNKIESATDHITVMHVEDVEESMRRAGGYHFTASLLEEKKDEHDARDIMAELNDDDELGAEGAEEDSDRGHRRYLPRERPFSLPMLIRRAHEGLGHPGNERLARILKAARASPEAIQMAKDYRCSICEQAQKVRPARAAAPPRDLHVNSIVGVDTIYLPGWDGKRRMALNVVCWASRFQMMIPLNNHTPGEARRAFLQWTRFFGPPDKIYSDLGKEFRGAFEFGAELDSTYIEPGSLEMPTQRSITERSGKSFKEVFTKALMNYACETREEWLELVDVTNLTMNRLSNKSGYSPIQRVLGYTPRIPGSTFGGGYNDHATVSRYRLGDAQVQRANRMRLAAARAYHEADCDQALQAALHAGHRAIKEFEPGQTVYFWRKGTDRVKKNEPKYWRGPAKVILASPPTTIWITFRGIVIKAAPEQLRHASLDEKFTLTAWIDDIAKTREEFEKTPSRGYIDLSLEERPGEDESPDYDLVEEEEVRPTRRIHGKRTKDDILRQNGAHDDRHRGDGQAVDVWEVLDSRKVLRRIHSVPRRRIFHPSEATDCPVAYNVIGDQRRTVSTGFETGTIKETVDNWREDDTEVTEPLDGEEWTGYTEFTIIETSDLHPGHTTGTSSLTTFTTGGETVKSHENQDTTGQQDRRSVTHHDTDDAIDLDEEDEEMQPIDENTEEPINDDKRLRSETPSEEDPGSPTKRARVEWTEILFNTLEEMIEAKKKKTEIVFNQLPEDKKERFRTAINKEINNNIETGAYKKLDLRESDQVRSQYPEKILQSRYVLVEKGIEAEDVEKAKKDGILLREDGERSTKAKARHVMKGFSEWGAEEFDAATPQVARESMMMVLQVLCSMNWTPGYLDFTQAFHSGDAIQRELYAEQPAEGVPGMHPKQLLRLMKCCYGLLDGPYAWYVHLKKLLTQELGYEMSVADPCLFFLFDAKRNIRGIIGAATDDLLHGGDSLHWERMSLIQKKYKLGKYSSGDGRFAGKEIKCVPGGIKVCQPMYTQDKIQTIPISKARKAEKLSYCSSDEIHLLRGLLGSLAWLAKESRPDLAGRIAILQQSMPRPYVQDMIEANALAREALEDPELGVILRPVPLQHLRVGTITDASWGNARCGDLEAHGRDFWEETPDKWIRHHVLPRQLLFHPGSSSDGPDLLKIAEHRTTVTADGRQQEDSWNGEISSLGGDSWRGATIFDKLDLPRKSKTSEKFLQRARMSSQAGYLVFFYDNRMEESHGDFPVSIVQWKSYRLKRNTVNTLSAECQALISGVGEIHWQRFVLLEVLGFHPKLDDWSEMMRQIPFTAVTDSKSLYDTLTTTSNASMHIEDKRTAIDVTILKSDFKRTRGRIRWIPGEFMLSDSLTKKMSASGLKRLLTHGRWSLSKDGCQQLRRRDLLLLA